MKLSRDFYLRTDTLQIARDLIGKLLVVPLENGERVSGMIVETEAYLGEIDKAAHSFGGRRTAHGEKVGPRAAAVRSLLGPMAKLRHMAVTDILVNSRARTTSFHCFWYTSIRCVYKTYQCRHMYIVQLRSRHGQC